MSVSLNLNRDPLHLNGEKLFECLGLSQFDFRGWVLRFDLGFLSLLYFPGSAKAKPILKAKGDASVVELSHLQITESYNKGAVILQFILKLKIARQAQFLANVVSIKASTELTRNNVCLRRLYNPESPHLLEYIDTDWQHPHHASSHLDPLQISINS